MRERWRRLAQQWGRSAAEDFCGCFASIRAETQDDLRTPCSAARRARAGAATRGCYGDRKAVCGCSVAGVLAAAGRERCPYQAHLPNRPLAREAAAVPLLLHRRVVHVIRACGAPGSSGGVRGRRLAAANRGQMCYQRLPLINRECAGGMVMINLLNRDRKDRKEGRERTEEGFQFALHRCVTALPEDSHLRVWNVECVE